MTYMNKWSTFLKDNKQDKESMLLLEARVKDIKKRYPKLDDRGWINWARRQIEFILGPKGVSKYLLWYARELINNYDEDYFADDSDEYSQADALSVSEELTESSD